MVLEVVPQGHRRVPEAWVSPADIDRVAPGLANGIRLHAFNPRKTPELDGQVSCVAADAEIDPRSQASGYVLRVALPPEQVARLRPGEALLPGMQAELFIRTGERTLLQCLLQPLADHFAKAWREQ